MIALCVGHSRTGDSGAVSVTGDTERRYNESLAERIGDILDEAGVDCEIICHYPAASYPAAMRWLGRELKTLKASLAVELHFNSSSNPAATGHEWLYWHGSQDGRLLARFLDSAMRAEFPGHPARGLKMITAKDNGSAFVRHTPCPAVIAEPFFGSNYRDWTEIAAWPDRIAAALANGLVAAERTFNPREDCGK